MATKQCAQAWQSAKLLLNARREDELAMRLIIGRADNTGSGLCRKYMFDGQLQRVTKYVND